VDISQKEARNTHNTTHRPYETQEERRSHQSVDATVLLSRGKENKQERGGRGTLGHWGVRAPLDASPKSATLR